MKNLFDIDVADPPPGPRVYTQTAPLAPFTVTLPDELLRTIFEISISDSQYAAKQLMLVARWVRLWLLQSFYAVQRVQSKKHLQSLRVCFYHRKLLREILHRTPNLKRLAVCHDALLPPSSRTINAENKYKLYPDGLKATLRELETTSNGCWSTLGTVAYDLSPVAFCNVTHARLGFPYLSMLHQLSDKNKVVLPSVTHLAFDVSGVDLNFSTSLRHELVEAVRTLVSSTARSRLQLLALELEPALSWQTATNPVYMRYGQVYPKYRSTPSGSWIDWRHYWLELALHRTKIVEMPKKLVNGRMSEWNARGLGRKGFWERVEEYGEVALPPVSNE